MLRNLTIWLAAIAGIFAILSPANGRAEGVSEYDLKLAFLYNFAQFTDWPATAFAETDSPFVFCMPSADAYGASSDSLQQKSIKGHKIIVRHIDNSENLRRCHLLFLSAADKARQEQTLGELKNVSVLTVSEESGISKNGSILNLSIIDRKLHFAVNLDAASQAKLAFSSKLLRLADRVLKEKE